MRESAGLRALPSHCGKHLAKAKVIMSKGDAVTEVTDAWAYRDGLLPLAEYTPLVRLDCGVALLGTVLNNSVHAFQGIKYATADRFSAPQEFDLCPIDTEHHDGIYLKEPSDMCAQPAQAGYNLSLSIMNAMVLPYATYPLAIIAIIFFVYAARAYWTFEKAAEYTDLEGEIPKPSAWSSPRVRGCGCATLLTVILMLMLPAWSWSGYFGVEDCLFLNVYKPAGATDADEPLPVMVWIHGGGYVAGSGRLDDVAYGSSLEMPKAGVIHVTLNYRLAIFGFLFLNDGETVANAALLDQLMALRWVQKHIHSFGGDPKRVLLYGHSAGGLSVMALQRMPAAKGLFTAAAAFSPLPRIGTTPSDAAADWWRALKPTGCKDVECVRGLSTSTLATLSLWGSGTGAFGTIPSPKSPNNDGDKLDGKGPTSWVDFVVADGESLTESWAVDVPMIVSGCREQGDFGAPEVSAMLQEGGPPAWPLTKESFNKWADDAGIPNADDAYAKYSGAPRQRWDQIGTDLTLFCGLRRAVGKAAAGSRSSPLYLNIWGYAVPFQYGESGVGVDVQYAAEGIDIWMTWGQPSADVQGIILSEEAKKVGAAFRQYLVDFARTATLSAPWKPYPAVCEYEAELSCSEQNAHARGVRCF